jgi:hypothetical protein
MWPLDYPSNWRSLNTPLGDKHRFLDFPVSPRRTCDAISPRGAAGNDGLTCLAGAGGSSAGDGGRARSRKPDTTMSAAIKAMAAA